MWGDAKFRALSHPQPNAQTLWVHLLSGPRTTILPGVILAGLGTLADDLRWMGGWSSEAIAECLREIEAAGMARTDLDAGVIWLPRGIDANQPSSHDNVKGWRNSWELVPECALKGEIRGAYLEHMQRRGVQFVRAWALVSGVSYPQGNDTTGPQVGPQGSGTVGPDGEWVGGDPGAVTVPGTDTGTGEDDTDSGVTANAYWLSMWTHLTGSKPKGTYRLSEIVTLERQYGRGMVLEECHGALSAQDKLDLDTLRQRLAARKDGKAWRGSPDYQRQKRDPEPKTLPTPDELRAAGKL